MKRGWIGIVFAVLAAWIPGDAHHSFSQAYFEDQIVSIEGEVVEFQYRNPHSWLFVNVEGEDGEVQRYGAEWANPRRLGQSGISADTLRPGDFVTISGSPGRNPEELSLHLKQIERPADGFEWTGPQRGGRGDRRR